MEAYLRTPREFHFPNCSGGTRFALSRDGSSFFYFDGSGWASSTNYATANDSTSLNTQIGSFASEVGAGTLHVKAFLKSNGTSPCEIDALEIEGTK